MAVKGVKVEVKLKFSVIYCNC